MTENGFYLNVKRIGIQAISTNKSKFQRPIFSTHARNRVPEIEQLMFMNSENLKMLFSDNSNSSNCTERN